MTTTTTTATTTVPSVTTSKVRGTGVHSHGWKNEQLKESEQLKERSYTHKYTKYTHKYTSYAYKYTRDPIEEIQTFRGPGTKGPDDHGTRLTCTSCHTVPAPGRCQSWRLCPGYTELPCWYRPTGSSLSQTAMMMS